MPVIATSLVEKHFGILRKQLSGKCSFCTFSIELKLLGYLITPVSYLLQLANCNLAFTYQRGETLGSINVVKG